MFCRVSIFLVALPVIKSSTCVDLLEFRAVLISHLFLPQIMPGLRNNESSSTLCQQIKFCLTENSLPKQKTQKEPTELTCEICQFSMGILQWLNSSGKLNFAEIPKKICQQLPPPAQGVCSLFWLNYGVMMEHTLSTGKQLSDTCKTINMCHQNTEANFTSLLEGGLNLLGTFQGNSMGFDPQILKKQLQAPNQNGNQVSNAQCQLCQWAISAIEAYLAQDTTEDELSRVFQELCTVLPGNYAEACENFVLVYMSEAVGFIIDTFTPPFVCSKIGFC